MHIMSFFCVCLLVSSKILESVVEGEEKEKSSSDESTKPLTKEEEMTDLRMETPELKVNECAKSIHCLDYTLLVSHVLDEENVQFQIGQLANTLTSKMEFLGINKKAISNFQLLLLQTEVTYYRLTCGLSHHCLVKA